MQSPLETMMSDSEKRPDLSSGLLREAQDWVVKLHSGRVSQADLDALECWRTRSLPHRRAFAEANLRWDVARMAAQGVVEKGDLTDAPPVGRLVARRAVLGGTAAAAVGGLAYMAVRPPLDLWPSLSELAAGYRTEVGEQRRVTLANASIEMNTRTSLSVGGIEGGAPQIELIAGEIAVTTASTSFTVIAGEGRTRASRAVFDLRRDGHKITVTCLDGSVQVECRGNIAGLQPRQQIIYDDRDLSSVGAVDPGSVEDWRHGLLVFKNRPLAQVVEEINRYRRGRIILLNAELGRLPLDATFRLDRIDEAVPKIAHVFDAEVRSFPGGLVFLS
jgi:transmembrane sensor